MNLPPYSTFPILIGDKVILRAIEFSDIDDLIDISFYDGKQASNVKQAVEMQEKINEDYKNGNSIHWGIFDKVSNKIVGTCGYYRGLSEGTGELGCVLLEPYYGKGFMTAAMQLAIDYGIQSIGLERIYAITSKENSKAIQLLDRLQFRQVAELEDDYLEFELQ